jgi:hypothetical protein
MNSIYKASALMAALALSACGGGGGSSSESQSSKSPEDIGPVFSLNDQYVAEVDGSTFTLKGTIPEIDEITIQQVPDIGIQIGNVSSNGIELIVPEVDRPTTVTILFNVIASSGAVLTEQISFLAENDDAKGLVEKANAAVIQGDDLVNLSQDGDLIRFFIDYAYLNGVINYSEKSARLSQFDPQSQSTAPTLNMTVATLAEDLLDYQQGAIGQSDLEASMSNFESALSSHSIYGAQSISQVSSFFELLVPAVSQGPIQYVPEANM